MSGIIMQHYFAEPEEVCSLAKKLADYFSKPDHVVVGIHELLLNAVEHGILSIDIETKLALLTQGTFGIEIARRLALLDKASRCVELELMKDGEFTRLSIRDPGKGFNWRQRALAPLDRSPRGRGLLIAQQCGFDMLTFNETGNGVSCYTRHKQVATPPLRCPVYPDGWKPPEELRDIISAV